LLPITQSAVLELAIFTWIPEKGILGALDVNDVGSINAMKWLRLLGDDDAEAR
jgi:hypothetical protein